jgi:hypothetical protein
MRNTAHTVESHRLTPIEKAELPPVAVETLWAIPFVGLMIALAWVGARKLLRRRRPKRL